MPIRPYHPQDAEALVEVYRAAARTFGPQGYGAEQVRMWASFPEDLDTFREELKQGLTLCAIDGETPVAFGQLHPEDHLQYLYTHPNYAGHGLARAILSKLEEHAAKAKVRAVSLDSSVVARSFYEKQGYRVEATERVMRNGVEFLRYRMWKPL